MGRYDGMKVPSALWSFLSEFSPSLCKGSVELMEDDSDVGIGGTPAA